MPRDLTGRFTVRHDPVLNLVFAIAMRDGRANLLSTLMLRHPISYDSPLPFYNLFTASSTSSAWPATFTLSHRRATFPAPSIRYVVRTTPMYFRP